MSENINAYYVTHHYWCIGQRGLAPGSSLRPHYKIECDALARFHSSVQLKKFKPEDLEQIRLLIQIVSLRYHETTLQKKQLSSSMQQHVKDNDQQSQPSTTTNVADDVIQSSWKQFLALASNKSSFPSSKLKMIRLRATAVINAFTDQSNSKIHTTTQQFHNINMIQRRDR